MDHVWTDESSRSKKDAQIQIKGGDVLGVVVLSRPRATLYRGKGATERLYYHGTQAGDSPLLLHSNTCTLASPWAYGS
jgi:hypothetical protein